MKLDKILMIIGLGILLYVGFQELSISRSKQTQQNIHVSQNQNLLEKDYVRVLFDRVVDGDTVIVDLDGERERVRLIGVDTPESVKPGSPVECFGREASDFLKKELSSQKYLYLEFDEEAGRRDRNGRILAHLFNTQAQNINHKIIEQGYGYEYTYRGQKYLHKQEYKEAQKEADKNKRGLWADGACKK